MNLILLILATWRVSSLVVREDGPYECFSIFRTWAAERYFQLFKLLECLWCVSIWIGFILMPLYLIAPILLVPFAASTVAIFLDEIMGKLKNG